MQLIARKVAISLLFIIVVLLNGCSGGKGDPNKVSVHLRAYERDGYYWSEGSLTNNQDEDFENIILIYYHDAAGKKLAKASENIKLSPKESLVVDFGAAPIKDSNKPAKSGAYAWVYE